MKNHRFIRNQVFYASTVCLLLITNISFGQTIKRQAISCYGSSSFVGNTHISQTAGQPYSTDSKVQEDGSLAQGFQQPGSFVIESSPSGAVGWFDMEIYPNPANSKITISTTEKLETANVKVYDSFGKVIVDKQSDNFNKMELNCDSWGSGIYLISLTDNNQNQQTIKLIITK